MADSGVYIGIGAKAKTIQTTESRTRIFFDAISKEKMAFGKLERFSETSLAPQTQVGLSRIKKGEAHLLLPLIGGIGIKKGSLETIYAEIGQIANVNSEEAIYVENPYPTETISYLEICLNTKFLLSSISISPYTVENTTNNWLEIFVCESTRIKIYLGIFDNRICQDIAFSQPSHLLVHILSGAFEVEDRFLEATDSLYLSHAVSISFEALAKKATLLGILQE
jgi:quercetin 2,3-dioxygenase